MKRLLGVCGICATSSIFTGTVVLTLRRIFAFIEGIRRTNPTPIHTSGGLLLVVYAIYVRNRSSKVSVDAIDGEGILAASGQRMVGADFAARILAGIVTVGTGTPLAFTGTSVEMALAMPWFLTARFRGVLRSLCGIRSSDIDLACMAGTASGVAANFNAPLAGFFWTLEIARRGMWTQGENETPLDLDANNHHPRWSWPTVCGLTAMSALVTALVVGGGSIVPVGLLSSSMVQGDAFYSSLTSVKAWCDAAALLPAAVVIGLGARLVTSFDKNVGRMIDNKYLRKLFAPNVSIFLPLFAVAMNLLLASRGVPISLPLAYRKLQQLMDGTGISNDTSALVGFFLTWVWVSRMCLALGHVGGLVAPLMVEGAALVTLCSHILPKSLIVSFPLSTTVQLGAAAMLAASFKAPLMATFLVLELRRTPCMFLPTLLCCVLASKDIKWLKKNQA